MPKITGVLINARRIDIGVTGGNYGINHCNILRLEVIEVIPLTVEDIEHIKKCYA